MINLYCERLDASFWAEPINALSNASFFIAAWILYKQGHRIDKLSSPIFVLIALMVSIGTGSFLFHTFATPFTLFLDVFPILLFQFVFMWVYTRRIIEISRFHTIGLLLFYIFFALLGRQFPQLLNGSISYLPAILLLLGLGTYHFFYNKKERFILLVALAVFSTALFFRTIDNMICPYFPIGTHFLWHIINGFLVYLSARAVMLNLPSESQ